MRSLKQSPLHQNNAIPGGIRAITYGHEGVDLLRNRPGARYNLREEMRGDSVFCFCARGCVAGAVLLISGGCAPPLPPSSPPATSSSTAAPATVATRTEDRTKNLTRLPGLPKYNLELVNGIQNPLMGVPIAVNKSDTLRLTGWAVDGDAKQAASGVEVRIDGDPYQATFGANRADVAAANKVAGYQKSGFTLALPAARLGTGKHVLAIRVISHDGKSYHEGTEVAFKVT